MRTTQAERDAERKSFNRGKLVSVGGGFYSKLLDDADLCARLTARVEELERIAQLCRETMDCRERDDSHWCTKCDSSVDRGASLRHRIDAALSPPAAVEKE